MGIIELKSQLNMIIQETNDVNLLRKFKEVMESFREIPFSTLTEEQLKSIKTAEQQADDGAFLSEKEVALKMGKLFDEIT